MRGSLLIRAAAAEGRLAHVGSIRYGDAFPGSPDGFWEPTPGTYDVHAYVPSAELHSLVQMARNVGGAAAVLIDVAGLQSVRTDNEGASGLEQHRSS